jgi:tRNA-splicing ligase RtcB (3'-phosphate/5'-hydroxy nucleic acid ligase)
VQIETSIHPVELPVAAGSIPIRCFTGADLMPDLPASQQLEHLAAVPGLDAYVAVLPDVHFKARNPSPTGTVVVSRNVIVPRAVDPGINCGMRIVSSDIPAREFSSALLDDLFGRLRDAIPLQPHERPILTIDECERTLVYGLPEARDALQLTPNDVARVENRGRMMPELDPAAIRSVISEEAIRKGSGWLGTLGAGNHFLELQEVVEVLDAHAARRLGLENGAAVFMLHSDSRKLGKAILKPLREQSEALFRGDYSSHGLWTLPSASGFASTFISALAAATHSGFANRAALTWILRRITREVFADRSLTLPLVFDCGHETIQREWHNGHWVWVHRHGASNAVPADGFAGDPVLGEVGQPVPIPGNMGSESYIAVTRPGVAATFNSVAHGAGRVMEKKKAATCFDPRQVENELHTNGIRLYRYGTDNIAGQAPASFKSVRRVVQAMTDFDLIKPVVRLQPIAVLKG